jgi:hypothetical protein
MDSEQSSHKAAHSKTETNITVPVVEVFSSGGGHQSPKITKQSKKLGDLAPEKASTGAARKVMEFFRRRAKGSMD